MTTSHSERPVFISIVVMLTYFIIDNHLPMFPWNNLAHAGSQWPSTLMGVISFGVCILLINSANVIGAAIAAIWSVAWLALQVHQWWVPYFFGSTPTQADLSWFLEGGYHTTLRILPIAAERPSPDLQHMVLQSLSLLVVVFAMRHFRVIKTAHKSHTLLHKSTGTL